MHQMKVKKYFCLFLILTASVVVQAQNSFRTKIKNSTFAVTDSLLPFWFTANQHGTVAPSRSFLNITGISLEQFISRAPDAPVSFTWGAELLAGLGESNYYQVNRAFAGIAAHGWELKAGLFYDETRYGGLSTTNGNLVRSENARPYPMVRFSANRFKPVPFAKYVLSFKAEYDEGLLNDERFVQNARLHHKSFYLRAVPATSWKVTAGFEHFVFWGGVSSNAQIGEMPSGLKAYLRYILGAGGGEDFPQTDQLNKAGNQLGTYQLEVEKSFPEAIVTFYLSHPFEDLSGVNLRNWPDNLLGIHIGFIEKQRLVTDLLYEFSHTMHQSIRNENDREPDSYFSHGIYRSGFTYHGMLLGSPLFIPQTDAINMVNGMASNRFFAHHMGISGAWNTTWRWKGLLTYSEQAGTVARPYDRHTKQLSGTLEVNYVQPGFPVEIGVSVAADAGSNAYRNGGISVHVSKSW